MAIISAERLAEAARLLLAANTSDWEDCDVCAVLEVECPYHQGRRDEHNDAEKPAEPIVWDGKRETWERITDLLPARYDSFVDECFGRIEITYGDELNAPIVASIPFGSRFVRFGDSFAILPPEVTP